MKRLKLVAAMAAALVAAVVIFQNTRSVTTRLLFVTVTMPNSVLILFSMLVGVAIGILLALHMTAKRRK